MVILRVPYSAVQIVINAVAENKHLPVAKNLASNGGLCGRGGGDVCGYGCFTDSTNGTAIETSVLGSFLFA